MFNKLIISPNKNQLMKAVIGGTNVMINIEIRAPINANAENKNMSPITNPIIPDKDSQSHACMLASRGSNISLLMNEKADNKIKAKPSRMILSEYVPTFFAAISKDNAVIVQNTAVSNAVISP